MKPNPKQSSYSNRQRPPSAPRTGQRLVRNAGNNHANGSTIHDNLLGNSFERSPSNGRIDSELNNSFIFSEQASEPRSVADAVQDPRAKSALNDLITQQKARSNNQISQGARSPHLQASSYHPSQLSPMQSTASPQHHYQHDDSAHAEEENGSIIEGLSSSLERNGRYEINFYESHNQIEEQRGVSDPLNEARARHSSAGKNQSPKVRSGAVAQPVNSHRPGGSTHPNFINQHISNQGTTQPRAVRGGSSNPHLPSNDSNDVGASTIAMAVGIDVNRKLSDYEDGSLEELRKVRHYIDALMSKHSAERTNGLAAGENPIPNHSQHHISSKLSASPGAVAVGGAGHSQASSQPLNGFASSPRNSKNFSNNSLHATSMTSQLVSSNGQPTTSLDTGNRKDVRRTKSIGGSNDPDDPEVKDACGTTAKSGLPVHQVLSLHKSENSSPVYNHNMSSRPQSRGSGAAHPYDKMFQCLSPSTLLNATMIYPPPPSYGTPNVYSNSSPTIPGNVAVNGIQSSLNLSIQASSTLTTPGGMWNGDDSSNPLATMPSTDFENYSAVYSAAANNFSLNNRNEASFSSHGSLAPASMIRTITPGVATPVNPRTNTPVYFSSRPPSRQHQHNLGQCSSVALTAAYPLAFGNTPSSSGDDSDHQMANSDALSHSFGGSAKGSAHGSDYPQKGSTPSLQVPSKDLKLQVPKVKRLIANAQKFGDHETTDDSTSAAIHSSVTHIESTASVNSTQNGAFNSMGNSQRTSSEVIAAAHYSSETAAFKKLFIQHPAALNDVQNSPAAVETGDASCVSALSDSSFNTNSAAAGLVLLDPTTQLNSSSNDGRSVVTTAADDSDSAAFDKLLTQPLRQWVTGGGSVSSGRDTFVVSPNTAFEDRSVSSYNSNLSSSESLSRKKHNYSTSFESKSVVSPVSSSRRIGVNQNDSHYSNTYRRKDVAYSVTNNNHSVVIAKTNTNKRK